MEQFLKPEEFLKIMSLVLSKTHDGMVIIDIKKHLFPIVYVNKGFTNITGYKDDEILGKHLNSIINFVEDASYAEISKIFDNPKPFSVDFRFSKRNGDIRDALMTFTPIYSYNRSIEYIFLIIEDITDKKKHIEDRATLKAINIVINSVNDIVFNYMNYLKLFHDDILKINYDLNNEKLQNSIAEFEKEYEQAFCALKKLGDLSNFRTKILAKGLEIIDV